MNNTRMEELNNELNRIVNVIVNDYCQLINLCGKIDSEFRSFLPEMATLSQFYAPTRYPDAIIGIPLWDYQIKI
jgi:hypothetical protein